MADNSKIEWTDATWNPVRARRIDRQRDASGSLGWHCEKVSAGCDNCYAQGINLRLGTQMPFKPGHLRHVDRQGEQRGEVEVFLDLRMLTAPLRWKKPRRIFVNSMTDSFGRFVTDEMLDRMFAVMAVTPHHTYQVLTKRPERAREYLGSGCEFSIGQWAFSLLPPSAKPQDFLDAFGDEEEPNITPKVWPLPNVWLGTSIEDQTTAEDRIPHLLATPAAVRFVSAEPLLGPVDLTRMDPVTFAATANALTGRWRWDHGPIRQETASLDLVIVGGESGPHARPMHLDWARSLRGQCVAESVAFFFKQWGEYAPHPSPMADGAVYRVGKKAAGRMLDGRTWDQMPGDAIG